MSQFGTPEILIILVVLFTLFGSRIIRKGTETIVKTIRASRSSAQSPKSPKS